tara:strand:+ start:609 stop:818 length:210 start_codon:yes stop_codon:yes gene_type:complete
MEMCNICYFYINIEDKAICKCWSDDINKHFICDECYKKESERRKINGFDYPNECMLCKPIPKRLRENEN